MVSTKSQIFLILYIKLVSDPCNTWKILIKYDLNDFISLQFFN